MSDRDPKVWIGCLAAYNNGRLHGEWVTVPEDADELFAEIKRVLAASPEPGAEEWFFADNEDFHPWNIGEWPDVRKLVLAAKLIRERGEAVAIWLNNDDSPLNECDDYDDLEERFNEAYAGEWDSEAAYARDFVENCGLPGVGFVHPESRHDMTDYVKRSRWSDTLDELDSILDWDAIYRHLDDGIWNDGNHYFRSV